MFDRSKTDDRRVIIVDFNHMAWAYAFGNATSLSCTLKIDGEVVTVNTTIPAYTIKAIHRWARGGINPIAVCFDGEASARCRKAYFAQQYGVKTDGKPQGYKARREVRDPKFYESINLTLNYLVKGGVACYKADGYEADDLIKACVDNAKKNYPNLPIDIITGDADLVPLVDDQVSVFLRSVKSTFAVEKSIEKKHYVQITPENYQSYIEGLSSYRNLRVPYNTLLLAKLLRGDKSDEIAGKPDWKPKMYNQLIEILEDSGEDLGELFRYDRPIKKYAYKGTTTEVPEELISTVNKADIDVIYSEPPALTRICKVLGQWCEPDDLVHIRRVYNGINLNGAFMDLPDGFKRQPAKLKTPIAGYSSASLQSAVAPLRINLYI